jgi:hypothetical protein
MNHKYIFFLILFHCSNTLIGMERNLSLILPKQTNTNNEKQWWYLDSHLKYNEKLQSVYFNLNGTSLITTSTEGNATVRDIQSRKTTAKFPINFCKTSCDKKSKLPTKTATILDKHTGEIITSFKHPHPVQDFCFDHTGKSFATICNQTARVFTRYDDYTLEQLQLKNAMNTWLLIKKPYIIIEEQYIDPTFKDHTFEDFVDTGALARPLLKEIADKQIISSRNLDELVQTWNTFPDNMQNAILRTMIRKIKRHGHMDIIGNMHGRGCIIMQS